MNMWLENGLVKIKKEILHQVTKYPILDRVKTVHCPAINIIEEHTKAKWNGRGISINGIKDYIMEFLV